MAQLDVLDTGGAQFRVGYNSTNYAELSVSSTGDLTIAPTGGDTSITGNLSVSGQVTGTVKFGTSVTTGSSTDELILRNAKALRSVTSSGTTTQELISLSAGDALLIGGGYSGTSLIVIPSRAAASLPAAGAATNGVLALDSTNNRIVFYVGGTRQYVTGTSF
jgi:hypothetical protein